MPRSRRSPLIHLLLVLVLIGLPAVAAAESTHTPSTFLLIEWLADWLRPSDTSRLTAADEAGPDADPNGFVFAAPDDGERTVHESTDTGDAGPDADPNG